VNDLLAWVFVSFLLLLTHVDAYLSFMYKWMLQEQSHLFQPITLTYIGYQNAPRSHLYVYVLYVIWCGGCLGTVSASSETIALAISLVLLLYIYFFYATYWPEISQNLLSFHNIVFFKLEVRSPEKVKEV
jgi:hypothetical protein